MAQVVDPMTQSQASIGQLEFSLVGLWFLLPVERASSDGAVGHREPAPSCPWGALALFPAGDMVPGIWSFSCRRWIVIPFYCALVADVGLGFLA